MSDEQMRPASKEQAPDPANTYERAKPERESPTGQLNAPKPPPAKTVDHMKTAVPNQQNPSSQINAEDSQSGKAAQKNTPKA